MPTKAATQTQLPSRAGTVFISYARADDEKPPHDDTAQGWVTFLWDQLRWELTTRGAKQAKLWLDRYQIDPAESFTPKIEAAVREAAVILPILSENWAQSTWCRAEVEGFSRARDDAAQRIVPIYKSELNRALLPSVLQGEESKEGYHFFEVSARGELNEFYWRGVRDREKYFERLRALALFLIRQLDVEPPFKAQAPGSGRTIFVARSASELGDARQRLVNDLVAAGHSVMPDIDSLPDTAPAFEAAIRAALQAAEQAVFLIGQSRGITPDGGQEPILDLQLRVARESVAAGRKLSLILWTPRWLPARAEDKRDPFEVAGRFGGLQPGEEVFAEAVTDLSQWLRKRLIPVLPPKATDHRPILLISAAPVDDDAVFALANLLQGIGPRVLPVACNESPAPEASGFATGVIVWESAGLAAVDACVARLLRGSPLICLILPDGDDEAKRRFFREGVVTSKLPRLPVDPPAARALLDRLGLLQSGDR